jgi:hypothetical protein
LDRQRALKKKEAKQKKAELKQQKAQAKKEPSGKQAQLERIILQQFNS